MPAGHPNADALLKQQTALPFGHPSIDPYLCHKTVIFAAPGDCPDIMGNGTSNSYSPCYVNVVSYHPSVDLAIGNVKARRLTDEKYIFPSWHVPVNGILLSWMPHNHSNVDELLRSGRSVPFGHPQIDAYMSFTLEYVPKGTSECPVIPFNHPSVDNAINSGFNLPIGHPKVDPMLREILPVGM